MRERERERVRDGVCVCVDAGKGIFHYHAYSAAKKAKDCSMDNDDSISCATTAIYTTPGRRSPHSAHSA